MEIFMELTPVFPFYSENKSCIKSRTIHKEEYFKVSMKIQNYFNMVLHSKFLLIRSSFWTSWLKIVHQSVLVHQCFVF